MFTDLSIINALMVIRAITVDLVSTSETSVNLHQPTWLYNPEDSQLQTRRREDLKSY
jgi:hypothetical protein